MQQVFSYQFYMQQCVYVNPPKLPLREDNITEELSGEIFTRLESPSKTFILTVFQSLNIKTYCPPCLAVRPMVTEPISSQWNPSHLMPSPQLSSVPLCPNVVSLQTKACRAAASLFSEKQHAWKHSYLTSKRQYKCPVFLPLFFSQGKM